MKIIDISDGTHTLGAELAFLDGLGTYSDIGKRCAKTDLLDGYLAGLAKRNRGFNAAQTKVIRERVAIIHKAAENAL